MADTARINPEGIRKYLRDKAALGRLAGNFVSQAAGAQPESGSFATGAASGTAEYARPLQSGFPTMQKSTLGGPDELNIRNSPVLSSGLDAMNFNDSLRVASPPPVRNPWQETLAKQLPGGISAAEPPAIPDKPLAPSAPSAPADETPAPPIPSVGGISRSVSGQALSKGGGYIEIGGKRYDVADAGTGKIVPNAAFSAEVMRGLGSTPPHSFPESIDDPVEFARRKGIFEAGGEDRYAVKQRLGYIPADYTDNKSFYDALLARDASKETEGVRVLKAAQLKEANNAAELPFKKMQAEALWKSAGAQETSAGAHLLTAQNAPNKSELAAEKEQTRRDLAGQKAYENFLTINPNDLAGAMEAGLGARHLAAGDILVDPGSPEVKPVKHWYGDKPGIPRKPATYAKAGGVDPAIARKLKIKYGGDADKARKAYLAGERS